MKISLEIEGVTHTITSSYKHVSAFDGSGFKIEITGVGQSKEEAKLCLRNLSGVVKDHINLLDLELKKI